MATIWGALVLMTAYLAFWMLDNAPSAQEALSKDDAMGFTLAFVYRLVGFGSAVFSGSLLGVYCVFRFRLGIVGAVLEIDERLRRIEEQARNEK